MSAIGFFIKKILSTLLDPLNASLVLLCGGLWLTRRNPSGRWGIRLMLVGIVSLAVLSMPVTAYLLTIPLESRAGSYCKEEDLRAAGVRHVVVLAASVVTKDASPADRMGNSIFRFLEGYRLWKGLPGAKLVLSQGATPMRSGDAGAIRALPQELGVPRDALVLGPPAWDTEDEAVGLKELLGKRPFALVTSAVHIPRAAMIFRTHGLRPIPCPCEFLTNTPPSTRKLFIPGTSKLQEVSAVIHEYVGMLWFRAKNIVLNTRGE